MPSRRGYWWAPAGSFLLAIGLSVLPQEGKEKKDPCHKIDNSPQDPEFIFKVNGVDQALTQGQKNGFLGHIASTANQKDVVKILAVRKLPDSELLVATHGKTTNGISQQESGPHRTRATLRWKRKDPHATDCCHKVSATSRWELRVGWNFERPDPKKASKASVVIGSVDDLTVTATEFKADGCGTPLKVFKFTVVVLEILWNREPGMPPEVLSDGFTVDEEDVNDVPGDPEVTEIPPDFAQGPSGQKDIAFGLFKDHQFLDDTSLEFNHGVQNQVTTALENSVATGGIEFRKHQIDLHDAVGGANTDPTKKDP